VNDKYDIDRSTGENVRLRDLPKRCFISHSYQDKAAIEKLRRILPEDVEPVIFPRRVSNRIPGRRSAIRSSRRSWLARV